ncbi:GDSL esterase/lipase-like protein [Drosera capensis]
MLTISRTPLIMGAVFVILIIKMIIAQSSASSLPFTKIFAFGDSYTDTGNTGPSSVPSVFNYASRLPYGMTFFHRPTNRYSDGRLVIDFVASSLSLHYLTPYRLLKRGVASSSGVNFAVAGSTAIEYEFFVKQNLSFFDRTRESLGTQLTWFLEYAKAQGCEQGRDQGSKCMNLFDNALFWVGEIGANDYAYTLASAIPSTVVRDLAIKRTTAFLKVILKKYAKYVVIQGLPPAGCLVASMTLSPFPGRDDLGCIKRMNQEIQDHNEVLQSKIKAFRKQFNHSVILYADYWGAYASVIKNLSKYGFTEPFKACCGAKGERYNFNFFDACGSPSSSVCPEPSKYINWDGVHLTEAMYRHRRRREISTCRELVAVPKALIQIPLFPPSPLTPAPPLPPSLPNSGDPAPFTAEPTA